MADITREQLEKRLKAEGSRLDLHGYDLSGLDLSNLDLTGADLREVNFWQTNLTNTNLTNTDLRENGLWDEMAQAVLTGANLAGMELHKCGKDARDLSRVNFTQAYLNRVDLSGNRLRKATITHARLDVCDFRGCDLREADLSGSWLVYSDIRCANLSGANLSGCNLSNSDLRGCNLTNVNFTGADLTECRLARADLSGAILESAILEDVTYSVKTIWPTGFDLASLNADVSNEIGSYEYSDVDTVDSMDDVSDWPDFWDGIRSNHRWIYQADCILPGKRSLDRWVNFSSDGNFLASGGGLTAPAVWKLEDGQGISLHSDNFQDLVNFPLSTVPTNFQLYENQPIAYTQDKTYFATPIKSSTQYSAYSIALVDSKSGDILKELNGFHPTKVSALQFSSDREWLASGSCDGQVKLWRVSDGAELLSLQTWAGIVRSLAFNPGDDYLVVGSEGRYRYEAMLEDVLYEDDDAVGMVHICHIKSGIFVAGLFSKGAPVRDLKFSPDGKLLAGITGSNVSIWETSVIELWNKK